MSISLYSAIYRRLAADSATAAIVGTSIWDSIAKDWSPPYPPQIVIEIEQEQDPAISPRPAKHYDVTVHCYAMSPAIRDALRAAVIASLDRQTWTDGNVQVLSVLLDRVSQSADAEAANSEQEFFVSEPSFHIIAGV